MASRNGVEVAGQDPPYLPLALLLVLLLVLLLAVATFGSPPAFANGRSISVCHGTTANGSLQGGWRLPIRGSNFTAYHQLGVRLGRTYVHDRVGRVVVAAYRDLAQSAPDKQFVYGETGLREGGRIPPHETHQNGLSVDFFVPVLDASGRSATLPASLGNKGGYDIEFDGHGRFKDYRIDYEAMARHLLALKRAADDEGIGIRVVIFDNALQPQLFAAPSGRRLKSTMQFSRREPWIRHDEHYHVDFEVACR